MASSVVGSLVVRLSAHTAAFSKGLKKAGRSAGAFAAKTAKQIGGMFKKMVLSATVAAAGIAVLVKRQMSLIDTTAKTARKLGISVRELSRFHYAAKLSGIAVNTFDMALQRMVRRVAEAAKGTGEAQEAIKTLGLNAKLLAAKSPDKIFLDVADALSKVSTQGERLRLMFKMLDSEGVVLDTVLKLGRKGIIDLGKEADRVGASFDAFDAAKIEAANEAVDRMGASFSGLFTKLSIELAPFVKMISDDLASGIISAGDAAGKTSGKFGGLAGLMTTIAATAQSWYTWMNKGYLLFLRFQKLSAQFRNSDLIQHLPTVGPQAKALQDAWEFAFPGAGEIEAKALDDAIKEQKSTLPTSVLST